MTILGRFQELQLLKSSWTASYANMQFSATSNNASKN